MPEKLELAELNLKAGKKAKASNAYSSAVKYLTAGMELLPEDCWQKQYELTYSLHLEKAECEYLNTNFEGAERLFAVILKNAKTKIDKLKLYKVQRAFYENLGKYGEVARISVESLKFFGMSLNLKPGKLQVMLELLKIKWKLHSMKIPEISNLPDITDPDKKEVIRILTDFAPTAYFINENLFALVVMKIVNISMKYGNSDQSSQSYS